MRTLPYLAGDALCWRPRGLRRGTRGVTSGSSSAGIGRAKPSFQSKLRARCAALNPRLIATVSPCLVQARSHRLLPATSQSCVTTTALLLAPSVSTTSIRSAAVGPSPGRSVSPRMAEATEDPTMSELRRTSHASRATRPSSIRSPGFRRLISIFRTCKRHSFVFVASFAPAWRGASVSGGVPTVNAVL